MPAYGVQNFVWTEHALFEVKRRAVSEELVRTILLSPEQRVEVRAGRVALQSKIAMGEPAKQYLVRVFVDIDRYPAEVVTVYRTSKIEKYWSVEP